MGSRLLADFANKVGLRLTAENTGAFYVPKNSALSKAVGERAQLLPNGSQNRKGSALSQVVLAKPNLTVVSSETKPFTS